MSEYSATLTVARLAWVRGWGHVLGLVHKAAFLGVATSIMPFTPNALVGAVAALSTQLSTAALDKNPQSRQRGITLDLGFSSFVVPLPAHLQGHLPCRRAAHVFQQHSAVSPAGFLCNASRASLDPLQYAHLPVQQFQCLHPENGYFPTA